MKYTDELIKGILEGNRRALAKSITLVESSRFEDAKLSDEVLSGVAGHSTKSIRIGISGVPGAGKSTFIEAFGMHVISQGKKVAVLAVDPTSPITGGSILGDKTRMPELTQSENAFIRPSPTSGNLGGVARKTKDTILLCEAAGYEVIIVETVGVGQSEVAVFDMTDIFLLLLLAGAGDELQGIKKGIMEMADIILINKADGSNTINAENAKHEFENALRLFKPKNSFWKSPVLTVSSLLKTGIPTVWETIQNFIDASGEQMSINRKSQYDKWLWSYLQNQIYYELQTLKEKNPKIKKIEEDVRDNRLSIRTATHTILEEYKKS
ncbi:MAG TPA: methylmalonyl Co-A mutase-associated GTPase MeaB [Leptospiraceae bacterium]|nr:methylmalonyl Co-A mutase-associated GTPase MeaB [Leptospiraceae bacterium]